MVLRTFDRTGPLTPAAGRSRPRIGLFDYCKLAGGVSRYTDMLARGIDQNEFDVVLFCRSDGPHANLDCVSLAFLDEFNGKGGAEGSNEQRDRRTARNTARAIFQRTTPQGLRHALGYAQDARRLAQIIRAHPVDLLHVQYYGCVDSCGTAGRLGCAPNVLGTFHTDSSYDLEEGRGGLMHRLLHRASGRSLHWGIAVSQATKQDWVKQTGLAASRITTVHNGVDVERFRRTRDKGKARRMLGLPDDGRVIIGGVGRLHPFKGFTYLIDAFASIASLDQSALVAIAGSGPLDQSLKEQANRLGIGERVRLLGQCDDVSLVYDALDVFVLSSLCEALPFALLEAMSHGLPVVGTTVAGVPEVIVSGETGFLVPPRDPAALAEAIRPLLDSAELRERLGAAGRERVVRHFSEAECVRKTLDVYRELVASGSGSSSVNGNGP